MKRAFVRAVGAACATTLFIAPALAEVTKFEITSVQQKALEGRAFGDVGTYDKIKAKVTVTIDPKDRRNAPIADITLAPKNAAGLVETVVDVEILKPSDSKRGNHTIFYEVVNRGGKPSLGLFNDGGAASLEKATDGGNGYLLRQGYTLVWSGWQGDFVPEGAELALVAPTVPNVTGRIKEELLFDNLTSPVVAALAWPAADTTNAKLTVRAKWQDAGATPQDMSFKFVDPQHVEITRPKGFDAGALYELEYTAKDSKVLGVGFATTRDIVTYLRRSTDAANPLAEGGKPVIERAYAFGQSQSGRYLREYLYLGFNEDMSGRQVFEAMLPQIGGARFTALNMRFGLPGRNARHPQDPAGMADRFPFTYTETTDPFTKKSDSLLKSCLASKTCPKIIQTDSEYEWWGSRASLLVTDPTGKALKLPDNVRLFLTTGTPHSARPDAVAAPSKTCVMPLNPLHQGPVLRALLKNLDDWVVRGTLPPDSRSPNLADGSLVEDSVKQLAAPIPGVPYTGMHVSASSEDLTVFPSRIRGEYKVYVPKIDADGNAVGGIRLPVHAVPKATYTGWNPRSEGYGTTSLCALQGGAVAFAETKDERMKNNDPRLSVQERYATAADYVAKVDAVAKKLVSERLMLEEDAQRSHQAAVDDTLAKVRPKAAKAQ